MMDTFILYSSYFVFFMLIYILINSFKKKYIVMFNSKNNKNMECECSLFPSQKKIVPAKTNKITLKKKEIPDKIIEKVATEKKLVKKVILNKPLPNSQQKLPSEVPPSKIEIPKKQSQKVLLRTDDPGNTNIKNFTAALRKGQQQPINNHNFKEILKIPSFTSTLPIKQTPAIIKKTILTSEYFSGLQLKGPEKKQGIEFSYQNTHIPTTQANIVRQASLNDFKKNSQQANKLKQEIKRSESEKQIFTKNKPRIQNTEQKFRNTKQKPGIYKQEKSKSVKSATSLPVKTFQELRPKSTISSGEDHSQNNSQFSQVIQHPILSNKNTATFYLQQEI